MIKIKIVLQLLSVFILTIPILLNCTMKTNDLTITSPNNKIAINISFNENNALRFDIYYGEKQILQQSKLGIIRRDADFVNGLKMLSVSKSKRIIDKYSMLHGKKKVCSYLANQRIYHLENKSGEKMDIIFRISDDGVAFRYYFPGNSEDVKTISQETTSYVFTEGTKAWIQPIASPKTGWKRSNPSYEEDYEQEVDIRELKKNESGWVYPALFNSAGVWMCITETAPYRDYCGTRLKHEDGSLEFTVGFPSQKETLNEKEGANPNSKLPWSSPWRIIAIGQDLGTIVESTLGTDLAKPSVLEDISYVKPGRASWSWVMLKDDSTIYKVQKRFIDYSADMGWEYCLIDADWDKKIGYQKIKELADYAAKKNVGLILWYNSAGPWNDTPYGPRDKMLTEESREKEFSHLKEMGIKGVKVDFWGGDGQDVMSYYLDVIECAAKYGIMVNTHGCTLPRGWPRTYPNLVTMEAIKGEEFCTFTQENADRQPTHCCAIPFTRNVFDPMDFTPVVFGEIPGRQRVTTNSFELALSVLFLSGIQHYAETAKGMEKVPDYLKQYLKDIPVSWDQSKFIDGYPGKLVIIARKTGYTWYVAGINGENKEKNIPVDLSFINAKNGELISDITHRETKKEVIQLPDDKIVDLHLLGNGGFVMKFVE
jgi:hypothetical protein